MKNKTDIVLVLLDDIQNYKPISGYLTILKNVLSDEEIVKGTGFLFVLASTLEGWTQFLQKHHPIGRYFTPAVKLAKLSKGEVHKSIDETLKTTGVKFEDSIKRKVFEYTEGHPLETQILCSYLYDNQIGGLVGEEAWEVSLDSALVHLGGILLDSFVIEASDRERQALIALAQKLKPLGWKEITRAVQCINKDFPEDAVGMVLARLACKQLLVQEKRGIYRLPDRIFREYILRTLQT